MNVKDIYIYKEKCCRLTDVLVLKSFEKLNSNRKRKKKNPMNRKKFTGYTFFELF